MNRGFQRSFIAIMALVALTGLIGVVWKWACA